MIKIAKQKSYRTFVIKKGEKGKKFKRRASNGIPILTNKWGVDSFKLANKDRYYIRSVKRDIDSYDIYLCKK